MGSLLTSQASRTADLSDTGHLIETGRVGFFYMLTMTFIKYISFPKLK